MNGQGKRTKEGNCFREVLFSPHFWLQTSGFYTTIWPMGHHAPAQLGLLRAPPTQANRFISLSLFRWGEVEANSSTVQAILFWTPPCMQPAAFLCTLLLFFPQACGCCGSVKTVSRIMAGQQSLYWLLELFVT